MRRQHLRVEDDLLELRLLVGDHRGAADFGARCPAVVGTATTGAMPATLTRVPVVAMSSKSQSGRVWPDHQRDGLADVERAAAAEGDHAVVPAGLVGRDAVLDVLPDRVALDVGEHRAPQAVRTAGRRALADHRQARQPGIGDEQRVAACPVPCRPPAARRSARRRSGSRSGSSSSSGNASGPLRASQLRLEVKRLRPRQVLVAERRQRAAAPGILDADPGQRRVEVVAAVHEPGAGLHAGRRSPAPPPRPRSRSRRSGRSRCRSSARIASSSPRTFMMPTTGPKISSRITAHRVVRRPTSTCGAR